MEKMVMVARFSPLPTDIADVKLLERHRFGDGRGFLSRLFCMDDLSAFGWPGPVMQVNETWTEKKGTVRGLHFQRPPFAEWKLVTCLEGAIWDVAVDLRARSPTFLRHVAVELSAENHRSLLIPAGFAHGFQALSDDVRLLYVHSAPYRSEAEGGLKVDDPSLAITWPQPVARLSPRDQTHAILTPDFQGMVLT